MQVFSLMKTQTMLSTYTTSFFDYLLEYLLVLTLLTFLKNHINMDISISNMSIPHYFSFNRLPKLRNKIRPLFYIKREIICFHNSTHFSSNCHVLP